MQRSKKKEPLKETPKGTIVLTESSAEVEKLRSELIPDPEERMEYDLDEECMDTGEFYHENILSEHCS